MGRVSVSKYAYAAPHPQFSRATSTSARCARRPIRWNAPLRRAVARPMPRAPRSQTPAPWRVGGSLCRCSNSVRRPTQLTEWPPRRLGSQRHSAAKPTLAAPLPAPRPAPSPGADSAPSRPTTRRQPEGPLGKRPAFHSAVARTLARPCVAP